MANPPPGDLAAIDVCFWLETQALQLTESELDRIATYLAPRFAAMEIEIAQLKQVIDVCKCDCHQPGDECRRKRDRDHQIRQMRESQDLPQQVKSVCGEVSK